MAQLQKAPWDGWETVRLIGRGSYGTVYEIQRKLVDEDTEAAALKVITIPQNPEDIEELHNEGYDDESITATYNTYLKGIVSEYSIMRKMEGSSNVVDCKDIHYIQHKDGFGWDIYIRMELLTPLMKAIPMDVPEATVIKIARDICSALVLCKKHEIVHRDIKPQNIFRSINGDYKLGDFGIAKTMENTMRGTRIGTFNYMAPEIYNNQSYGSAADIYSLGLVLYWLLNARRMPFVPLPPAKPVVGQDVEARLRRLAGEKLPPPAYGSEDLKRIVLKACAYDPAARYATAVEMLKDLHRLDSRVADAHTVPAAVSPEINADDKTMLLPTEAGVCLGTDVLQPPSKENAVQHPTEAVALKVPVITQCADLDATAVLVEPVVATKPEASAEKKCDAVPVKPGPAVEKKVAADRKEREAAEEKAKHQQQWYEFQYEEQKRKKKEKVIGIALLALGCVAAVALIIFFLSIQFYISS